MTLHAKQLLSPRLVDILEHECTEEHVRCQELMEALPGVHTLQSTQGQEEACRATAAAFFESAPATASCVLLQEAPGVLNMNTISISAAIILTNRNLYSQ